MAKRLSDKQKEEIIKSFSEGITIQELSEKYNCTKLTISRNLKKNFDDKSYRELIAKGGALKKSLSSLEKATNEIICDQNKKENLNEENYLVKPNDSPMFMEIAPLSYEIDNLPQKDFASFPLSEIDFPKIVYMIVDNKIELDIKLLKDYPEWEFLSDEDLNRKTIKIYYDFKIARRDCNKDQKVIKVPNPNVFKIVAPILISRGISRIISAEKLIAL